LSFLVTTKTTLNYSCRLSFDAADRISVRGKKKRLDWDCCTRRQRENFHLLPLQQESLGGHF